MDPKGFYHNRLAELNTQLKQLKQRKSSFAWLRLGSIAAIVFAFYLLWSLGVVYVVIATLTLLFIFMRLIYADLKNQAKIEHTSKLININENELKCLAEDYYDFERR